MDHKLDFDLCTAMVTPFLDGKVNYPMLKVLIERQLAAGIGAICVCATTGEGSTLSDDEKLSIIHCAVKTADGRCRILAGTGSNDTLHAVALSRQAQEAGADGVLVVSPYYNKANISGLIGHYSLIAGAVSIPVIVYNVPARTGMDIQEDTCAILSKLDNIIGIKEASNDLGKLTRLKRVCAPGFRIWSGNDDQALSAVCLGGNGVISVLSNLLPGQVNKMIKAAKAGDLHTALALHDRLHPLTEALFSEVNPIPVKAAMGHLGYDCGLCRLPLGAMDSRKKALLLDTLDALVQTADEGF